MTIRGRCVVTAAVAGAIVATVAATAGCGTAKVVQKTAQVTVGGNNLTSHTVSCTQVEWLRTVEISADPAHVRAVLRLDDDKPKAESVNIDNVNGFSGIADTGAGKAEATFTGGSYHITGTALRTNPDNPDEPETAAFSIDVTC